MGFKHAGKLSCFIAQRRAGIVKVGHKIGRRVLKNPYLFEEIYDLGIFQLFTARDLSCCCDISNEFSYRHQTEYRAYSLMMGPARPADN